jgi:hypothetical protein
VKENYSPDLFCYQGTAVKTNLASIFDAVVAKN